MQTLKTEKKRESFSSQMGLVLAAVGSAVGLGNIWRFSYITGRNGGGAFLLVYLLCVILVGMPLLIAEITLGRNTQLSTVSAFKKTAPKTHWWITGLLAVIAPTIILAYYPVVTGWSIGYMVESITSWNEIIADTGAFFAEFSASGMTFVYAAIALVIALAVLVFGVSAGIEKCSKFLMPALGIIVVILVIRSCTLEGSGEGIKFLLVPDFSKLSLEGFLEALGHSFFSLSLGMGIMITYGSYMKKDTDLPKAVTSIAILDTGVALLAGLAIFPAVFALGLNPGEGAGLAFVTLPAAFAQMPGGQIFSVLFFLLIFIAALTSMVSIAQVPVAWMEDELKFSRRKALIIIAIVAAVMGIPSVLSFSTLADFKILGSTYFDFLDKLANNILLPITGLLTTLFVIFRWGVKSSKEEFLTGAKGKKSFLGRVYPVLIKFVAPIAIGIILLNSAISMFR